MLTNDDRAAIPEQYSQACTSSNLRCEADKRGAADVLIASGMSDSRLGSVLMRLLTKADRTGLEVVHQHLTQQAKRWNIENPEVVTTSVLSWWLNQTCTRCAGVCFEVVKDSPSLSARNCKLCQGSGQKKLPYGESGKQLARYIDDCKQAWSTSIKKRLRPTL